MSIPGDRSAGVYWQLLQALERARTRLAVTVAAESKKTTAERWSQYMQTEDRMRRCVKRLRLGCQPARSQGPVWAQAIEELNGFPESLEGDRRTEAQKMCHHLSRVLSRLEPDLD